MIKIAIEGLIELQKLFDLLHLPGNDKGLAHKYEQLMTIVEDKNYAAQNRNFEQADELRHKELKSIRQILSLLDERGITNNGWLNIRLEPSKELAD